VVAVYLFVKNECLWYNILNKLGVFMAKISKQGKALVKSIAEFVGKDNQQIVEVVEKIDIYVQENKKAFDELSELEHQDLSEPSRLLRQVAEVFYSQTKLKNIVIQNLKRASGNLAEKDKLLDLYDTFEQFDYTCPYSDTLLIGSDASSTDPNRANVMEKGNTDVMMLVSINPTKKTIKLISFMRDSYTYMDKFDRFAKLNAACANGGPSYLVETIENDYKIKIDGYVMVDFDSFIQVIDVLGGVRVDVPEYVAEHLTRSSKGKYFPRGNQVLLNGEEALKFSRVRYTDADGDISRVARQRQVINALIKRCKTATLSEINAVSDVILANIRTNISKKAIA
jgi:LCP family protein required for cell wall assembly